MSQSGFSTPQVEVIDAEVFELARRILRRSTRPAVYEAHQLATEVVRLSERLAISETAAPTLPLPKVIGPVTGMVQEIAGLCGEAFEGCESNCEAVSVVLNAAKRYVSGERA